MSSGKHGPEVKSPKLFRAKLIETERGISLEFGKFVALISFSGKILLYQFRRNIVTISIWFFRSPVSPATLVPSIRDPPDRRFEHCHRITTFQRWNSNDTRRKDCGSEESFERSATCGRVSKNWASIFVLKLQSWGRTTILTFLEDLVLQLTGHSKYQLSRIDGKFPIGRNVNYFCFFLSETWIE